jgi:hypothetical protein
MEFINMPKNDININAMMTKVIKKHSTPIDFSSAKRVDLSPAEVEAQVQKLKEDKKHEMVAEMSSELKTLYKKGQISFENYENAAEALKFYDEKVTTPSFQDHPRAALSELAAIDYSKPVEIVRVKAGRKLTQMQRVDNANGFAGNFYAEGVLPGDYKTRADQSGIGVHTLEQAEPSGQNLAEKSVYISTVEANSTFLRTTASPAVDTWSIQNVPQQSQGGGIQWRVATSDAGKVTRPIYTEVDAEHAPSSQKGLKRGMQAPTPKANLLIAGLIRQADGHQSDVTTVKPVKKGKQSSRTR